jgi:hypothetical protein
MKTIICLSALAAFLQAQVFVPVYGCEWVPPTIAVTNFTFSYSTSNDSSPSYVQWQAPTWGTSCNASNPTSTGSITTIGKPGTVTYVPCKSTSSDPTTGSFQVTADDGSGSNATLNFVAYAQCAADIFQFDYEANFPLACATDAEGIGTCVPKGNATAVVIHETYLPPIRGPGPPPHWQT